MKKIILFLLIAVPAIAQQQVRINPNPHDWIDLIGSSFKIGGNTGKGVGDGDSTEAFSAKKWQGVAAIFGRISDGSDADTCITAYLQLKNNNMGWGAAGNSTDWQKTKIDTVFRDIVTNNGIFYLDLGGILFEKWTVADSARIIFQINTTDSVTVDKLQILGH